VIRRRCSVPVSFAGYRFPPDLVLLAVRWYLRYGFSYRDVEELLAERGIDVDHVTIYRWVQRFTPLVIDATRPCRHSAGDRWFVDDLLPEVLHDTSQFANNRIGCDHGRLKARLRRMSGLRTDRTARVVIGGTRSSRTCGAVTMNSESKPATIVYASRQRSTN
jgi:transposase-like protein